ncbi:MAG: hypothetical protein ACOZIN_02915 [Myxococcota bacterium]
MAIPPEPIDEVLPKASAAVLAEVSRIVLQDKKTAPPPAEFGATDLPGKAARQVVELTVKEVLFGSLVKPGATIEVIKPAGDYALRVGNHGPFLLQAPEPGEKTATILGRYGPDTYPTGLVKAALKRHHKE